MVSGSPIIACLQRAANQRKTLMRNTESPSNTPDLGNVHAATLNDNEAPKSVESHAPQVVLPIATRARIVAWMKRTADEEGESKIASKTVREFPQYFRGTPNANITRAVRLWKQRGDYTSVNGDVEFRGSTTAVTRNTMDGFKRVYLKARKGRGRKRQAWVEALHIDLRSEFDRLRKLGVKFNLNTLRSLALHVLSTSETMAYSRNMLDPLTDKPLFEKVSMRFVQSFADRYRIVSRAQKGKHRLSPEKEVQIEREVAYHLGTLRRLLSSGEVDENDLSNADETHFVVNLDNGRTLGFVGEDDVKYADVVSGGEGMTMVVRLSGGRDAMIETPFMVFMNKDRNYPIRGTPDNVPGVAYRTGPKGWMDTTVMPQWLCERRVIKELPNGRQRILYVDNCSGHNYTPELRDAAEKIRTTFRYFPPNSTHLIQPCDSFIIQKIKRAWTTRWEKFKMDMIREGKWKDNSGKLFNPGKLFFLRLAADAVRDVNRQRDSDGLSFARKAMIMTGMALNTNGQWEVSQLTPQLQNIVSKHMEYFDGKNVVEDEGLGNN